MRLMWKGFLSWLETTQMKHMVHLEETLKVIASLGENVSQATLKVFLEHSKQT